MFLYFLSILDLFGAIVKIAIKLTLILAALRLLVGLSASD